MGMVWPVQPTPLKGPTIHLRIFSYAKFPIISSDSDITTVHLHKSPPTSLPPPVAKLSESNGIIVSNIITAKFATSIISIVIHTFYAPPELSR